MPERFKVVCILNIVLRTSTVSVATNLELILYVVCVFQIISWTAVFYCVYCILLFELCYKLVTGNL